MHQRRFRELEPDDVSNRNQERLQRLGVPIAIEQLEQLRAVECDGDAAESRS